MPLSQSGPDLLTVTTVLSYMGLAAAFGVAAVSLFLLFLTKKKGIALVYLSMAGLLSFSLIRTLIRLAKGLLCYRPLFLTVLLYGGLILLYLSFLWDSWCTLRRELSLPGPCSSGKRGDTL